MIEIDIKFCKLLSSTKRIKILGLLRTQQMTTTEIANKLKISKATAHEHLAKLVKGGLVKRNKREGHVWVFYSLSYTMKAIINGCEVKLIL